MLPTAALPLSLDDEVQYRCAGFVQAEIERYAEEIFEETPEGQASSGEEDEDEEEEPEAEEPAKGKKSRGKKGAKAATASGESPSNRNCDSALTPCCSSASSISRRA